MSDATQREWRFYLDDMIGFAEKVIAYNCESQGVSREARDECSRERRVCRLSALRGIGFAQSFP